MPSFLLRAIDPHLWATVKAKAKAEGRTLRAVLLRLLTAYAKGGKHAWLVIVLLTASACAHPLAPSPTIPARPPSYVIVGDSVALLGPWWPTVQAAVPGEWQNYAVGSTYAHTSWQPNGAAFLTMHAAVSTTPTAFLMHLGANDTVLQPPPTEASVFTDLQRIANTIGQDYPGAVLYLADVGQVWTYGDKRPENGAVCAAIHRAWRELPNVRPGPAMQDLTPDDGVHFLSTANAQIIADRWIHALH